MNKNNRVISTSVFFLIIIMILTVQPLFAGNVKADIAKQVKKAIKDGKALKSMNDLAIISVWGVNWITRGEAGPGDIAYADNIEVHRSWMPGILNAFQPQLESTLQSTFDKTGQSLLPISAITSNSDYQSFMPVQTEPKKGRGYLLGSLEGLKFIDDNAEDIAAASQSLNVDGVITIRYYILPSLLPLKKNQIKIWMKIFTKEGTLVWFGKMYGEFKGGPPKLRKYNSLAELIPSGEKEALKNMNTLYRKSFKKAK